MQGLLLQPFVFSMALYFLFISFTPLHKPSVILFIIQMVFMSSDHHRITQTNSTSFSACRPLYTQHTVYFKFTSIFPDDPQWFQLSICREFCSCFHIDFIRVILFRITIAPCLLLHCILYSCSVSSLHISMWMYGVIVLRIYRR